MRCVRLVVALVFGGLFVSACGDDWTGGAMGSVGDRPNVVGTTGAGGTTGAPGTAGATILNAGFESPPLDDNAYANNLIPGWVGTNADEPNNFGVYNAAEFHFGAQAPEGANVAYIERGAIYQTIGLGLEAGSTYTLSAWLGDSLIDPIPGYSLELRSGGTILASHSSTPLVDGEFVEVTLQYSAAPGDDGAPLDVWIVETTEDKSTELYIDSVTLTVSR
jgi:hypothetical protein